MDEPAGGLHILALSLADYPNPLTAEAFAALHVLGRAITWLIPPPSAMQPCPPAIMPQSLARERVPKHR